MISRSIRWQLAVSYAAIALVAALALGAVLLSILRGYYAQRESDYLTRNARTIAQFIAESGALTAPRAKLSPFLQSFTFLTQTRVRVTDASGGPLADPGPADAGQAIALSSLPMPGAPTSQTLEFPQAVVIVRSMPGDSGGYRSFDLGITESGPVTSANTIQIRALARDLSVEATIDGRRSSQVVRVPIIDASGKVQGYVELSHGPAYGREILDSVARGWAIAGAAAVVLATMAGWLASRRISAPVLALAAATERMASGDLTARADTGHHAPRELGSLARSFNRMADQVEETVQALRRFVSDAAHELHTPLTALRTNLELATTEDDAANVQPRLERAQAQVQRLEKLTDGLLELSRIEANAVGGQENRVDLVDVIRQMAELEASRAEQAGLNFVLNVPDAVLVVKGQEERLCGLLANLLDNAIKFTSASGTVTLGLKREDRWAVLWVADTGIGIPAEDLPHLFSRFHRGRNTTDYPGNGLGLAIVRAIAESHGGLVCAENLHPGARFVVRLPLEVANST